MSDSAGPPREVFEVRDAPRAPVAWAYAIAAGLGTLGLFRYVNPDGGVVEHWPWQLPSPFEWSPEAATQLFFTILALAPLVAVFVRASPRRGLLVGGLLALSLAALATLARTGASETTYHYGVETFVPPLLAAGVAAALYAGRASGRGLGIAAVCGAVLATLLFYPSGPDLPASRGARARYSAPIPDFTRDVVRRAGESAETRRVAAESGAYTEGASAADIAVHPWSVGAILSLAVGACGVAAAFAPRARRGLAWVSLAAFLVIALYPLVWLGFEVFLSPELHEPARTRLYALVRAIGTETRYTYAPFLLGLFAAAADLLRTPLRPRNVG